VSDSSSRASSTSKKFRRKQRGKFPSKDDFLTDDELRDRELQKVHALKVETNIKARKLAIMQEHRQMLEQANAITRNPRRRVVSGDAA
jgi:hypothetical protein